MKNIAYPVLFTITAMTPQRAAFLVMSLASTALVLYPKTVWNAFHGLSK